MTEQPPRTPLERHLADSAEKAIPADLDLWPDIWRRLRGRGPDRGTEFTVNGAVEAREIGPRRSVRHPLPPGAHRRQRSGDLVGTAVSFALAAFAIAIFAIVAGRPGTTGDQASHGSGTTGQFAPALATPPTPAAAHREGEGPIPDRTSGRDSDALAETEPVIVADPACSFDVDVSLETGQDRVVVAVRAGANWACGDTGTLRLTIVDAPGARFSVAGNPLILPLQADGMERRADAAVAWTNWCGEREQFRIETTFGDEHDSSPLSDPPRCVDANEPSTIRIISMDASIASPALASPHAIPAP